MDETRPAPDGPALYSETVVAGHLKTLSICHYVYSGLAVLGAGFGGLYVAMGTFVARSVRDAPPRPGQQRPPREITDAIPVLFATVGGVIILGSLTLAVLCFLSARGLAGHRHRVLSLVVAGICCVTGLPGITLGVFTFIILLKPEAERLYARAARN